MDKEKENGTEQGAEISRTTKARICVLSENNIEKLKNISKELNELICKMNL